MPGHRDLCLVPRILRKEQLSRAHCTEQGQGCRFVSRCFGCCLKFACCEFGSHADPPTPCTDLGFWGFPCVALLTWGAVWVCAPIFMLERALSWSTRPRPLVRCH